MDLSSRIGKSDIDAIISQLDQSSFNEIISCLFSPDRRTSDNAAWLLTHLPSQYLPWLKPHISKMIAEAISTTSQTKCRLILTTLLRLNLTLSSTDADTPSQQDYLDLLDFCLAQTTNPVTPVGIRSVSIKIAHRLCLHYPELQGELQRTLQSIADEAKTPAIRSSIKKITKEIEITK